MMDSGFSWPSTTLVCSDEYTSAKLIEAGAAPRCWNSDVHSGLTGTRIFRFLRSSGVLIGRTLLVIWRKPELQILSMAISPTLVNLLRRYLPRSPSSASCTLSSLEKAKPSPYIDETGTICDSTFTPDTVKKS